MRDILFRGKRLDNGEWVYGGLVYTNCGTFIVSEYFAEIYKNEIIYFDCEQIYEIDSNTVGQFTGQYDKCGDRIFEGDIVYCAEEDENAEIKWDEETSRFVIEFYGWISDFDSFYGRDLEIVGNIYEEEE